MVHWFGDGHSYLLIYFLLLLEHWMFESFPSTILPLRNNFVLKMSFIAIKEWKYLLYIEMVKQLFCHPTRMATENLLWTSPILPGCFMQDGVTVNEKQQIWNSLHFLVLYEEDSADMLKLSCQIPVLKFLKETSLSLNLWFSTLLVRIL